MASVPGKDRLLQGKTERHLPELGEGQGNMINITHKDYLSSVCKKCAGIQVDTEITVTEDSGRKFHGYRCLECGKTEARETI